MALEGEIYLGNIDPKGRLAGERGAVNVYRSVRVPVVGSWATVKELPVSTTVDALKRSDDNRYMGELGRVAHDLQAFHDYLRGPLAHSVKVDERILYGSEPLIQTVRISITANEAHQGYSSIAAFHRATSPTHEVAIGRNYNNMLNVLVPQMADLRGLRRYYLGDDGQFWVEEPQLGGVAEGPERFARIMWPSEYDEHLQDRYGLRAPRPATAQEINGALKTLLEQNRSMAHVKR